MHYLEYFQDSSRLVLNRLNGQQFNYQKNGFGDLSCSFLTQLLGLCHQQKRVVSNCGKKCCKSGSMLVTAKDEERSYTFLIQALFEREELTESGCLSQESWKISCFTKRTLLVVSSLKTRTSL